MKTTFLIDTISKVGNEVSLYGWVDSRRDHKKVVFIDLRDRSGKVQVVGDSTFNVLSPEDVVCIKGIVKKRPEKLINPKIKTGEIEIEAKSFEILSKAATLPFDFNKENLDVGLPTLLDYRSLTLRHPKVQSIFKVQEALIEGFREAAHKLGCVEVFVPTISASATEGGAELFNFDYFEHKAFLVQSPQLYKQMMVGVFEKVFLLSHIYRAEPSVTTRHLVESIQMDFEIGFIEKFEDLLDSLEFAFSFMIEHTQNHCEEELKLMGVEKSKVLGKIPRLTMREAQEIIFKRTGVDHRQEKDLMPEDEREIAKWAYEEHDSDLVTITHFPTKKRAFYSMPDPANPEYSLSYDLLYKGLEVSSGAQRIHDYNKLIETIKSRGMSPEGFYMYLQAFQYGMPPHGGFSYGLERTTMKLLNLENVREASLYPRDMERVDIRLSTIAK
jgi:nondiscriminating aspartyl-tRNA synthetase